MPAVDRNVLRIGVYELLWGDADVPETVAVSEALHLVQDLSTDDSPAFVNGLLGSVHARPRHPGLSRRRRPLAGVTAARAASRRTVLGWRHERRRTRHRRAGPRQHVDGPRHPRRSGGLRRRAPAGRLARRSSSRSARRRTRPPTPAPCTTSPQQPLGGVLVWVIAIGMFLLVALAPAGVRLRLPRGVRRHEALAQARRPRSARPSSTARSPGAPFKTATGDGGGRAAPTRRRRS